MSRFLTTHVGSLPRPEYLLDLVFAREEGAAVTEHDFEAAVLRATGEIVVIMDADCQNDPADLPAFLDAIADKDIVCGIALWLAIIATFAIF